MTSIYDQHRATFSNVSAYVVMDGTERVATIAFKFGGSVMAYVHWVGLQMTRGRAGGGGYDRQSAACRDAARKIKGDNIRGPAEERACAFIGAMDRDDGYDWRRHLEDAGFKVWSAV